jgi:transcriptional regulator with XRE-family HTH domain
MTTIPHPELAALEARATGPSASPAGQPPESPRSFEDMRADAERRAFQEDPEAFYKAHAGHIVAKLVLQLRRDLNLTQEQLAARSGLNRSYIARLESGDANPTITTLLRVLGASEQTLEIGRREIGLAFAFDRPEPGEAPGSVRIGMRIGPTRSSVHILPRP